MTIIVVSHNDAKMLTWPKILFSKCESILAILFHFSHSDKCAVVSHCVLIYIYLMASDVEQLLMCSLGTPVSPLVKCLSSVHFLVGLFFLLLHSESSLYCLDVSQILQFGNTLKMRVEKSTVKHIYVLFHQNFLMIFDESIRNLEKDEVTVSESFDVMFRLWQKLIL